MNNNAKMFEKYVKFLGNYDLAKPTCDSPEEKEYFDYLHKRDGCLVPDKISKNKISKIKQMVIARNNFIKAAAQIGPISDYSMAVHHTAWKDNLKLTVECHDAWVTLYNWCQKYVLWREGNGLQCIADGPVDNTKADYIKMRTCDSLSVWQNNQENKKEKNMTMKEARKKWTRLEELELDLRNAKEELEGIKVGDKVKHVLGSPIMMVASVNESRATCSWFWYGEHKEASIPKVSLEKVPSQTNVTYQETAHKFNGKFQEASPTSKGRLYPGDNRYPMKPTANVDATPNIGPINGPINMFDSTQLMGDKIIFNDNVVSFPVSMSPELQNTIKAEIEEERYH